MRELIILLVHLIASMARLMGPGGARSVIAESLLVKHQLLILNRSRQRSPNFRASDRILFWPAPDLYRKLSEFQDFYNEHRTHSSLDGRTPMQKRKDVTMLNRYRWEEHCRGLYQTPIAA